MVIAADALSDGQSSSQRHQPAVDRTRKYTVRPDLPPRQVALIALDDAVADGAALAMVETPSDLILAKIIAVREALSPLPRHGFDVLMCCLGKRLGCVGWRAHQLAGAGMLWVWEMCASYLATVDDVTDYAAKMAMRALRAAVTMLEIEPATVERWGGRVRVLEDHERHGRHLIGSSAVRDAIVEAARTVCAGAGGIALLGDEIVVTTRRLPGNASQKDCCPCGQHRNGDVHPSLIHGAKFAMCAVTRELFLVTGREGHELRIRPIGTPPDIGFRADRPNTNHLSAPHVTVAGTCGRYGGRTLSRGARGPCRARSAWSLLRWSEAQANGPVATIRAAVIQNALDERRIDREDAVAIGVEQDRAVSVGRWRASSWRVILSRGIAVPASWECIGSGRALWRLAELPVREWSADAVRAAVALVIAGTPEFVGSVAAVQVRPDTVEILIGTCAAIDRDRYDAIGSALLRALGTDGAVDPSAFGPSAWMTRPAWRVLVDETDDGEWSAAVYRARLLLVDTPLVQWSPKEQS